MSATVLYVQRAIGGGSANALYELLRRLDRHRVEPIVAVYEDHPHNDRFRELDVRVVVLGRAGNAPDGRGSLSERWNPLAEGVVRFALSESQRKAFTAVHGIIRRERVDLVHHNNNLRANRASVLAASIAGVPQVCHMRFFHQASAFDRWIGGGVDHFLHISRAIADSYRRVDGHGRRGSIIYDPVDLQAFASSDDGSACRAALGVLPTDRVVTNIGRLVEWKGQEDFLRAMRIVLHQEPRVRGVLVGAASDTPEGERYRHRLGMLADELGIADRIIFAGFRRDVPAVVAASEVVVHSSSSAEPLGLVIVEALAGGRAVVATAAGGVLDLVEDGITGRLVPLRDPPAMAQAVIDLLRDPSGARRMAMRGRAHVESRFDANRHAEEVQRLYVRVLSEASARRGRIAAL